MEQNISGFSMKHYSYLKCIFCIIASIVVLALGCGSKSSGGGTGPTIFVAADGVFKSSDGGQSWSNVLGSVPFRDVSFSDTNHGCATRVDVIHCTEDGGDSWPHETSMSTRIFYIQMLSSNVGYAFGDSKLYKTTNGGASWTSVPFGDITVYGMQFLSESVGYLFGNLLLKTANGGESWDQIGHPADTIITAIFFVNENEGYLGSFEGHFFATSDGGSSWEERPATAEFSFDNMAFSATATGFGVAEDDNYGLIMTTDGGLNWQKIEFNSLSIVTNVAVVGDKTAYAVGVTGGGEAIFAVTEDSGATWTESSIEGGSGANAISVIP